MKPTKAIKKQKILNADVIKFNLFLYHDKTNANVYGLFDQSDCYIIRYDKKTSQYKRIWFDYLPNKPFQYTEQNHALFLDEYTTFKDVYAKRKNTSNPRYDMILRTSVNTNYVSYKRFKELERWMAE